MQVWLPKTLSLVRFARTLLSTSFCGILSAVPIQNANTIVTLYAQFDLPITTFDCGKKCAPHNAYGVPFCCDTSHAVPTAYQAEWEYLQTHTDLWHLWEAENPGETHRLRSETPVGQVLIECLGHLKCQREYRSITCRAFPFFPYITREGEFIGLSYYWQYEDRCWVISHLETVNNAYQHEFVSAYDQIFKSYPEELENFRHHSTVMRRIFGRQKRAIPLIHRNGKTYKITPRNGRLRRIDPETLPKFGPYRIAALLPFPDER
jgi:hypothetical protein